MRAEGRSTQQPAFQRVEQSPGSRPRRGQRGASRPRRGQRGAWRRRGVGGTPMSRHRSRPGGRLSKSVAKARIAPERWKRIVGVPRFFSPPIPARDVFATDLDNRPPRVVPEAPPVPLRSRLTRTMSKSDPSEELRGATTPRAGELTRRTCVCYALFPLLRSFTLRCTRKRSVAEGEGAQQRERGAADDSARPRRPRATGGSHGVVVNPGAAPPRAPRRGVPGVHDPKVGSRPTAHAQAGPAGRHPLGRPA